MAPLEHSYLWGPDERLAFNRLRRQEAVQKYNQRRWRWIGNWVTYGSLVALCYAFFNIASLAHRLQYRTELVAIGYLAIAGLVIGRVLNLRAYNAYVEDTLLRTSRARATLKYRIVADESGLSGFDERSMAKWQWHAVRGVEDQDGFITITIDGESDIPIPKHSFSSPSHVEAFVTHLRQGIAIGGGQAAVNQTAARPWTPARTREEAELQDTAKLF